MHKLCSNEGEHLNLPENTRVLAFESAFVQMCDRNPLRSYRAVQQIISASDSYYSFSVRYEGGRRGKMKALMATRA
eukprot:5963525-Pleurochrysis_carterae.AAC.1